MKKEEKLKKAQKIKSSSLDEKCHQALVDRFDALLDLLADILIIMKKGIDK